MHFFASLLLASTALAAPSLISRDDGPTAAGKYGWGAPVQQESFDGTALPANWTAYDGPGQDGKGIRSPKAISVANSILTITGTPDGTTGGISWANGQLYGRWEARARYTAGTSAYHCVLLLWPDAEDWPVGGEVDYSEIGDGTRQSLDFFLHFGAENEQEHGAKAVDMTTWRNFAVEWTKDHVAGFVDGEEFFRSTNLAAIPPRTMHATIQLDWFPDDGPAGPGKMEVDWIRQYGV